MRTVGPIGYRVIDTTKYANGLHTIAWAVTDSAGVSEGIGSRYFTIRNGASITGAVDGGSAFAEATADKSGVGDQGSGGIVASGLSRKLTADEIRLKPDTTSEGIRLKPDTTSEGIQLKPDVATDVRVRRGYDDTAAFEPVARSDDGAFLVRSDSLDRLEACTDDERRTTVVSALPIGSSFDVARGLFQWHPGPGFIGQYELAFLRSTASGETEPLVVRAVLEPQQE